MKQAMALFEHETKLVDEIPESAEVVLRQAGAWRTEKLDGLWQAGKNQISQLNVFYALEWVIWMQRCFMYSTVHCTTPFTSSYVAESQPCKDPCL